MKKIVSTLALLGTVIIPSIAQAWTPPEGCYEGVTTEGPYYFARYNIDYNYSGSLDGDSYYFYGAPINEQCTGDIQLTTALRSEPAAWFTDDNTSGFCVSGLVKFYESEESSEWGDCIYHEWYYNGSPPVFDAGGLLCPCT